ncbi:MAG: hypothetical protein WC867_08435 [Candidatus Pacearchaeota archaeon]|jgi:hypothetical protein
MGIIRLDTNEELHLFHRKIVNSFSPCSDRDCPLFQSDYKRELGKKEGSKIHFRDGNGLERVIELIPRSSKLDLSTLDFGTSVYFNGGSAASYTLKIAENNMVKIWRDCDSNALTGPINKIISRESGPVFYEGLLSSNLMFVMPYFKYNTDGQYCQDGIIPITKEVLQPNEIWTGDCIFLAIEKLI